MAKDMFWTTVTFAFIISILLLAFWPADTKHVTVKYDCSQAEVNTDYPVAVKEACRKRNVK
jgi:uncharacterized integral membrane protein